MKFDAVLILDFGGQYCHLIGRRVRENKVYSEIVPYDISADQIAYANEELNIRGIILSGGPSSIYERDAPRCKVDILGSNLPILGLCYGHQLIAHLSGGKVRPAEKKEYGITRATIDMPIGVLKGLRKHEKVWMSHGDTVYEVPEQYQVLAHTTNSPVAAFKHVEKQIYGIQWHPEVVHTVNGMKMLRNFLFEVCKSEANYKPTDFLGNTVEEIKRIVGNKRAITALSGGVDSSTATILAAKAIGRNLTAVFVDHGFMRAGEPEFVKSTFKNLGIEVVSVDAKKRFLLKLKGVSDPERKRKIIGREFIRIFERVARKVGAEYLVQGTIYPDRIESGFRKHSEKIKTHHNVGGLPTKIEFKSIVEPLADLYKDEVRQVADHLGLPKEIVHRQPFPGPGLAVRIVGEVTPGKIDLIKKADGIVTEEIEKGKLRERPWQYFAVLTDTKSTGVKGDTRAYGCVVAIRAVESQEAMTAQFANIPYKILEKASTRLTNEIPRVTRVVYDITNKPPATIEWE